MVDTTTLGAMALGASFVKEPANATFQLDFSSEHCLVETYYADQRREQTVILHETTIRSKPYNADKARAASDEAEVG
jgi:hypothetical protein